ncbi:uncharacterized protein ACR2FA_012975 isoform 2-T2 [Aphomia sociella]
MCSKLYLMQRAFVVLGLCSFVLTLDTTDKNVKGCGVDGDCLSGPIDCNDKCGCDKAYYYNETTKECVLDVKFLMRTVITKYNPEEIIKVEAEKVFKGIMVSAIIVISCASLCIFTSCFYCVRINYKDRVLKGDVKALAKKLNRTQKSKKSVVKPPEKPESQSCNIIVGSAGLYVV